MNCPNTLKRLFRGGAAFRTVPFALLTLGASLTAAAGDTDWVVLPYASASRRMLLHALRDSGKPLATDLRLDNVKGKIRSLRIGHNKSGYSFAGINSYGVAVVVTGGDPCRDKNPKNDRRNYSFGSAINLILRNCRTAEHGAEMLRDAFKKSLISGSMIFMIADAKRAFVVECSPKHFASSELTNGFCVYANCWEMPNMQDGSRRSAASRNWYGQRVWTVCEMLRRARTTGNTVSLAESFAASRIGVAEINAKIFEKARDKGKISNTPANKFSADGVLFEIDGEFPAQLSTAYIAFGPQRHTVHLPVPIGAAEKLPAELANPNSWKAAALARQKAAKPETPIDRRLVEFENRMLDDFAKKREEARKLLRDKNTADAKKLLQETLQRQTADLNTFLQSLKK